VRVEKLGDLKESNTLPTNEHGLQLVITNDNLPVRRILKKQGMRSQPAKGVL
jgi:hypothetical protein